METIEKKLTKGQVLRKFQTNTVIFNKIELEKLLNSRNFVDGSAEYWTVLIDEKIRTEMWIRVGYNPTTSDERTNAEKGWE